MELIITSHLLVLLTTLHVGYSLRMKFSIYDGDLMPIDPKPYITEHVTFTCELLSNPQPNKQILFYVKPQGDVDYVPAAEADVRAISLSVSQYVYYVGSDDLPYTTVQCFYSVPIPGVKPSIRYQIGSTSTILPQ